LRSPEDIAFTVALFIARKKGSFVNYYMVCPKKHFMHNNFVIILLIMIQYHGGTNFGRFASSYVTTSYYDGAPLDEYGTINICR